MSDTTNTQDIDSGTAVLFAILLLFKQDDKYVMKIMDVFNNKSDVDHYMQNSNLKSNLHSVQINENNESVIINLDSITNITDNPNSDYVLSTDYKYVSAKISLTPEHLSLKLYDTIYKQSDLENKDLILLVINKYILLSNTNITFDNYDPAIFANLISNIDDDDLSDFIDTDFQKSYYSDVYNKFSSLSPNYDFSKINIMESINAVHDNPEMKDNYNYLKYCDKIIDTHKLSADDIAKHADKIDDEFIKKMCDKIGPGFSDMLSSINISEDNFSEENLKLYSQQLGISHIEKLGPIYKKLFCNK